MTMIAIVIIIKSLRGWGVRSLNLHFKELYQNNIIYTIYFFLIHFFLHHELAYVIINQARSCQKESNMTNFYSVAEWECGRTKRLGIRSRTFFFQSEVGREKVGRDEFTHTRAHTHTCTVITKLACHYDCQSAINQSVSKFNIMY